jgi:CRP-like cAMP-binding protein
MAVYDSNVLPDHFAREEISDRVLSAGETLFQRGEKTVMIYFVLQGEIRVETYLEDGRSIVFYRARAGAALGEENLRLPYYLYTAVAAVDSKIRAVSKASMVLKIRSDWKFAEALTQCLADRYAEAMMYRELLAIKSAEERLLLWLHWQKAWDSEAICLEGRMGSIGPDLSLSRESVYRAFARLEKTMR